ncbi:MAG: PAS domain S-box protein [Spirochaetes bacterium]|nr:PAS domain S-box protein [Spirochaetota bacterium]
MINRKTRTGFFLGFFILAMIIPALIFYFYYSDAVSLKIDRFVFYQSIIIRKIKNYLNTELEKLKFFAQVQNDLKKKGIINSYRVISGLNKHFINSEVFDSLLFIKGKRIIYKGFYSKKTHNKKYILDSFSKISASKNNSELFLLRTHKDTYTIASHFKLKNAGMDLIACFNLSRIVMRYLKPFFDIKSSNLFFIGGDDSSAIFCNAKMNKNVISISQQCYKSDDFHEKDLKEIFSKKKGKFIGKFPFKEHDRIKDIVMSWQNFDDTNLSIKIVLLTSYKNVNRLALLFTTRISFLLIALLLTTVFIGVTYYRIRQKAYRAAEMASAIPGLKHTIEELDRAKERFSTLFNSIMDGILLVTLEGVIIEYNQAFADMLGYSLKGLKNQNIKELTPPKWWEFEAEIIQEQVLRWGFSSDFEKEFRRKDGSIVSVLINAALIVDEPSGNSIILSTAKDISSAKRAEQEIKKLHMHLQDIIESSPLAIITLDEDQKTTSMNTAAEKLFQIKRDLILGEPLIDSIPFFKDYKLWFNKVDTDKSAYTLTSESFTSKGDGLVKFINLTFYPLLSYESGGIAVHIHDITEQTALERQLFQSQKIEALDTLAGGFAHDFNNLLSGMFAYITVLKNKIKDKSIREKIDILDDITKRASSLVQHILTFSKSKSIEAEPVSIKDVCEEVVNIISRSMPKNIQIKNTVENKGFLVIGDHSQISQVLLNLCINAGDSMPKGGHLSIDVDWFNLETSNIYQFNMLKPGNYVKIMVSDSGIGIPVDVRDRMFDPFFTTKTKGKGTGLGLAIVYGILRNHNGDITVYSVVGKGTTITIYLPIAEGKKKKKRIEKVDKEPAKGHGTILVIDDEEVIRKALSEIFGKLGYTVISASNGDEGIEFEAKNDIDLVILDLAMPGLSGEETFDKLKKRNPDVRVLIHTGFSQSEINKRLIGKGVLDIIHKPFDMRKLAQIVASYIS